MEIALAIGAVSLILGGLFGVIDDYSQMQEASRQKTFAEKQANAAAKDSLDLLNLNFEKDKTEAAKKAEDLTNEANLLKDKTNLAEKNVAYDFNKGLDLLQAQNESDLFNFNTAAMNAGQSNGAALSNTAASGIRAGSSLSDAIDMEASLNSQQLQLQENQSYLQNDINLNSLLNNMNNQNFGITENRYNIRQMEGDADYLRKGYQENGIFTKLYNQQKTNINNNLNRQLDSLNFNYNEFTSEENRIKRVLGDAFHIGGAFNSYGTSLFTMPDYTNANFKDL